MKEVYLISLVTSDAGWKVAPTMAYTLTKEPPIGLQYLSSSLTQHGVDSKIFDQAVDGFSLEDIYLIIRRNSPLFVGIISDSTVKPRVIELARTLKEHVPKIPIIIGGPACVEYEEFHTAGCDIVCHGEGEVTICEIADIYLGIKSPVDVTGISFIKEGEIIKNQPRSPIDNLDSIPFPARDKIQINEYYDYQVFGMKKPYVTVITSRGCRFRCTFCASPQFWHSTYRLRTPGNVVDEIEELIRKYKIRYIGFKDDIFGFDSNWVDGFVHEMKVRNLKVSFSITIHPFTFKNKRQAMLTSLKEVGLDIIVPGLQSVDEKVLKGIHRSSKEVDQLEELIQEAKKLSISTVMQFIFGLPGDSPSVFKKNLKFALKVRPHYAVFYCLSRLPGTKLDEEFKNCEVTELSEKEIKDWTVKCQKRFYLDPMVVIQNGLHVLRKNPGWFWVAGRNLRYLMKASGITR